MTELTPDTIAAAVVGVLSTLGAMKGKKYLSGNNGSGGKKSGWTKEAHDEICDLKLKPIKDGIERIEKTLNKIELSMMRGRKD